VKLDHKQTTESYFFGVPLADELFTLTIATYLTPGIARHHSSDLQGRSSEYVLAVKSYYTIKWLTYWLLGFAEGLSYADKIPYLEEKDMQERGYPDQEERDQGQGQCDRSCVVAQSVRPLQTREGSGYSTGCFRPCHVIVWQRACAHP